MTQQEQNCFTAFGSRAAPWARRAAAHADATPARWPGSNCFWPREGASSFLAHPWFNAKRGARLRYACAFQFCGMPTFSSERKLIPPCRIRLRGSLASRSQSTARFKRRKCCSPTARLPHLQRGPKTRAFFDNAPAGTSSNSNERKSVVAEPSGHHDAKRLDQCAGRATEISNAGSPLPHRV